MSTPILTGTAFIMSAQNLTQGSFTKLNFDGKERDEKTDRDNERVGKEPFNSEGWLEYFRDSQKIRSVIRLSDAITLDESVRKPLLRSLQRFHIGETGEGHHLRKYARRTKDSAYSKCIDLFIKEEQSHSMVLAQIIVALNGTLLRWHWTNIAFTSLRRILGLKTEIMVLLIAEIIGKTFYQLVAEKIDNALLSNVLSLVVLDEIAHIQFLTEFLDARLSNRNALLRQAVHYIWCATFYAACFVFVADHREVLSALGISRDDFINRSAKLFHRSASKALGFGSVTPTSVSAS